LPDSGKRFAHGGEPLFSRQKNQRREQEMAKTKTEQLASIEQEIRQLNERKKKLMQQQSADERKARSHRFCKRGGYMEKLLPDLALITDEQFETFFKNTAANNFGRKALAEIMAQDSHAGSNPETAVSAKPAG
jgi:hypothetical protein